MFEEKALFSMKFKKVLEIMIHSLFINVKKKSKSSEVFKTSSFSSSFVDQLSILGKSPLKCQQKMNTKIFLLF